MKAKYIIAESQETAEARAAEFFGIDKKGITFEVISGGESGDSSWMLLAMTGSSAEITNMDAAFGVYYEPDGVYLEFYEARGSGHKLDNQSLMQLLERKNLTSLNSAAVQEQAAKGSGRIKIAPPQQELKLGEDISIEIQSDEMEASARLIAPEPGGPVLTLEAAKQKLEAAGVVYGVDETALSAMIEAKDYGGSYVIATASAPEDGEDGKLIFNFSSDERTGRPREIGGGRVDYRSLDLYEPVTEGQLLVTRTLATEGVAGKSVTGKELSQKPGKDATLPRGKNVDINTEKTEMHAMCSGMVQFQGNSVNVTSLYKINGDVDLSVGNIDFDGSVQVSGSVRSGNTIKATGGVVIGGMVEAATIIAGGNVEIKGGMQGAGKGRVESGGTVTALYVERGAVVADGSVNVDVCIHSQIESGGTLTAKGKRGAIIGGRVGVAGNVIANFIGAVSNTQTEVIVGVVLRKRERIQFLEKEVERLKGELIKLDQLSAYLEKTKDKMDKETWDKLFRSGVENRRINEESLSDFGSEVDSLKYEVEHATDGRVHVFETVYAGTRIIIGTDTYKVNDEISYATFRYKDGQVVYGSCELSKSKD